MTRLSVAAAILLWAGLTILFSCLSVFQKASLADRLRAYVPGAPRRSSRISAARSTREVVGPLAVLIGGTVAKVFGVEEEVRVRLERIHATETSTQFRVRQAAWSIGTLVLGIAIAAISVVPGWVALVLIVCGPLLAFLLVEHQLARRSEDWKRRVTLELPIVAEQLAMLLGAGYSLGSALHRLSERTTGAIAADLRRVQRRVLHGVTEAEAIGEWARLVDVRAVDRLASVLRLHGEASDLGRLVAQEAKACREEAHRALLEIVERKDQMVWIPVTVAALVPGCIFLAVPFMNALTFFAG